MGKIIADHLISNIWECEDCKEEVGITPDWYEDNGTPTCCDNDMKYSHTEMEE